MTLHLYSTDVSMFNHILLAYRKRWWGPSLEEAEASTKEVVPLAPAVVSQYASITSPA